VCHGVTAAEFLTRHAAGQYKESKGLSVIGLPRMGKREFP
jgi:hypothetical protein